MPSAKRWAIAEPVPEQLPLRLSHLHPLLVQVLANRGVAEADMGAFINHRGRFADPFRMIGVRPAVDRLRAAIRDREPIVVYGDFDADGVTATVLLVQVLAALGADVRPYIPHRVDEGYGLHADALDRIAAAGGRVVVTVDCGIRSHAEVAHGSRLGLAMIVTDHHAIDEAQNGRDRLPPALAVINPKQDGDPYPFKDLAGVGIAFKLAQALLLAERAGAAARAPVALKEADLLDLVALGTVADLAPLLGENRDLVRRGLEELNRSPRPGVLAMLHEAGIQAGKVDAAAIGFMLGPRINAAGRLASAQLSYDLLNTAGEEEARSLAQQLGDLNRERQELTRAMVELAWGQIEGGQPDRLLHLVAHPDFPPGIVGLVAGRLADDLYRPVLVAQKGEEETHGSARSIPEFDVTAALDRCAGLLVRHGGHAAAAGFTVRNENLDALAGRLEEIAREQLAGCDLTPSLAIDAEVRPAELDYAFVEQLSLLEPFGNANPQPIWVSRGLQVVERRVVGADGRHLKLRVRDPSEPNPRLSWDAIAFRLGDRIAEAPLFGRVDLAYAVEVNEYVDRRGPQPVVRRSLQFNVKDLRAV